MLDAGPPYDRALARRILSELRRFRSPYSVQDHLAPAIGWRRLRP